MKNFINSRIRWVFAIALIAVLVISIAGLFEPQPPGQTYGTLPSPKTLVTTNSGLTSGGIPYIDATNDLGYSSKITYSDTGTGTLTTGTFSGALSGNATTATSATSATSASALSITDSLTTGQWSGITTTLTAANTLAFGNITYVNSSSKMDKARADSASTMPTYAMATATISGDASGVFLLQGFVCNSAWNFTPGALLYVSAATAGAITSTIPASTGNQDQIVGVAITATIIYWNPNLIIVEHS